MPDYLDLLYVNRLPSHAKTSKRAKLYFRNGLLDRDDFLHREEITDIKSVSFPTSSLFLCCFLLFFHLYPLLFLITLFHVAVQLCMEWITIKKIVRTWGYLLLKTCTWTFIFTNFGTKTPYCSHKQVTFIRTCFHIFKPFKVNSEWYF